MVLISRLIVIDCASFWYVPTNTTTWRHLTTGVGQHLPAQTFVPSWCNPGQDPDPARAISATRCLCALLSLIWFSFSGPVGDFIPHLLVFCGTFPWSFLFLRPLSIHTSLIYSLYSRCCPCRWSFLNVITYSFHQRLRDSLSCHCESVPLVFISTSTFYRGGEL